MRLFMHDNVLNPPVPKQNSNPGKFEQVFSNVGTRAPFILAQAFTHASTFMMTFGQGSSCMAFAVTLVNFLQMIDALSLVLYLPTKLTRGLDQFLAGISKIGDPIDISPQLLLKSEVRESYTRYRGKIEADLKPVLILQSQPVSSLFYVALEAAVWLLYFILSKRYPSLKLNQVLKEKKPWYKLESLYSILENQRYMLIESRLVDIAFNATLNMACFYQSPKFTVTALLNLAISTAMFSRLVF